MTRREPEAFIRDAFLTAIVTADILLPAVAARWRTALDGGRWRGVRGEHSPDGWYEFTIPGAELEPLRIHEDLVIESTTEPAAPPGLVN